MITRQGDRRAAGSGSLPPGLSRLRLGPEHLESLRRQGILTEEAGPDGSVCHKLRFRYCGRQIVRYVRRDPALLAQIRRELEELQTAARLNRRLRRLRREVRFRLRAAKARLSPALEERGLSYHGLSIRRKRYGSTGTAADSRPRERRRG